MKYVAAHPITRVVGVFVLSRAVILMVLLATRVALSDELADSTASLLCRWDCNRYLQIADNGYAFLSPVSDSASHAFFPLYPLLIAIVSQLSPLSPLMSGLLLSNAFFVVALVYVFYYARDVGFSHRVGMLGVTLLAFAPPSVVFSSAMTESLFLMLLAAAVFHMRRGQYVASAIAAALLTATRPNGLAFVAFAVVWLVQLRGWRDFLRPWTYPLAYLPIVLAPLGVFVYWGFSFATVGDAFAHATANLHGWGWGATGPLEHLLLLPRLDPSDLLLLATGILGLVVALLLLRYRLYAEFALVLASYVFYWSGGIAPWSMPRFLIVLFPLAIVMARALERRPGAAAAALAVAGTLNGLVLTIGWAMREFVV